MASRVIPASGCQKAIFAQNAVDQRGFARIGAAHHGHLHRALGCRLTHGVGVFGLSLFIQDDLGFRGLGSGAFLELIRQGHEV